MKNQQIVQWLLVGLLLFCGVENTFSQTGNCASVKSYGAKGNGTARDAKAIQDAINDTNCIFFPQGTYNISDTTIDILSARTLLFESDSAVLKYTGNGAAVWIRNEKFITWHRGRIDLTTAGNTAIGLHIRGLWNSDFFGIRVDRKSPPGPHSQVAIKIETSETGGNNFGTYVVNFYKPILTVIGTGGGAAGTAAIQTLRTPSDGVNVTHLGIYGGWITRGTNIFNIRNLSHGLFENIASEEADGDIYDIDKSNDILIIPGELPTTLPANAYDLNLDTTATAITVLTRDRGQNLRISGQQRPSILSRSYIELYGNRIDPNYSVRLSSDYSFGSSMNLAVKGGGPEVKVLEWGDAAGLTIRSGSFGGIKLGDQGAAIKKLLSGTKSWDPPSISNGTVTSTTVPISGVIVGDPVTVGFSQAVPAGAMLFGAVTASGTVTVTLYNRTGASLNLASGTLRADVWQH